MAQIDASIYNLLGSGVKSPEEYQAERQGIESNALSLQSARAKMAQEQAAAQRQGQLQNLLAGGAGPDALVRGGFMDEAAKRQAMDAGAAQEARAAKRFELEQARSQVERAAQLLGSARDQASYNQARMAAQAEGLDMSGVPDQFDPAWVAQTQRQYLTLQQQLEQHWKQQGYDLDVRQQNEVERNNRTQNAISRGNLAVSQGNLAARLAGGGGGAPSGGKAPSGYRYTADGSLEPIPGGPAEIKADERNLAKQAGISSVNAQIAVIDKALAHPGRKTATGLSGTIDPRNYIPGTDSADFQSVLDQIGGTAFLQAFESLKGGGQITEVEGKKATDAIARLSRKQSDAEFEKSLQDLRSVMELGKKRLLGSASMTPQDKQALDWANSNPGDPRAAKIKQKLGM